jgi:glycosyltransferase involved in cell wall biosynthesis
MNQTVLFTVVYPECEPYLEQFFNSVKAQDTDGFELMVLNDGLENLERYTGRLHNRIEEIQVSGTIADVRRRGIQLLTDRPFDTIVFADADDYISTDRIRKSAEALDRYDIYINDLTTVTHDKKTITKYYLSKRLNAPFEVPAGFILKKNIIGLGNTSVRRSALRDIPIPSGTIAVDWMIFTDMLLRGASAVFKTDSVSYYRQHEENTAGLKNLSVEKINQGITVQIQNASFFADRSDSHKNHLDKLLELKAFLADNSNNINVYKQRVEEILPQFPLWWEEIQTLDQLSF